jgi:protein-tyrosine-phosphatase
MIKIRNILIVCSGNTARSPVGEYLGKYYAKQYNSDLLFDSCGFFNAFSYMQPESQEYLKSKGIDPSGFYPKVISKSLLEKQDLIITMEDYHVEQIRTNFGNIPNISEKTFTLKEFNDENGDIIDPYYTNRTTYLKVMKELDHHIEKLVKKVIEMNQKNQ